MRNSITSVFLSVLLVICLLESVRGEQTSAPVVWDTINTGAVRLAVSNHGSIGLNGIGGANMDFTSSGFDCDSNANVYLYSGGLLIIQKIDSAAGLFTWSSGLYQTDASASFSFKPDESGSPSSNFTGPGNSDAFFTGRFLNWDSTIGIERTYYAPTTGTSNDNFIVVRTDIYPLDGLKHPELVIGEVIDWKIPSDSDAANTGGIFGKIVYLQGSDTGAVAGCQPNSNRFGSSVFLGMYTNTEINNNACANNSDMWGTYTIDNLSETASAPNGILDSASLWNATGALTGQWVLVDSAAYQRIYSTFVHGYILAATDTLTVYTAIVSQRNGVPTDLEQINSDALAWYGVNMRPGCEFGLCIATGDLDSDGSFDIADLTFLIDHLYINFPPLPEPWQIDVNGDCVVDASDYDAMWDCYTFCLFQLCECEWNTPTCCDPEIRWPPPCCVGNTGNIDNDADGNIDIADLTALIDNLFINFAPLACREKANIDGDTEGNIDIADLTHLIDHLFINFPPTAPCQ